MKRLKYSTTHVVFKLQSLTWHLHDLGAHSVTYVESTPHGMRYAVDVGDGNFQDIRDGLIEKARKLGFLISASTDPNDDLAFTIWPTH